MHKYVQIILDFDLSVNMPNINRITKFCGNWITFREVIIQNPMCDGQTAQINIFTVSLDAGDNYFIGSYNVMYPYLE